MVKPKMKQKNDQKNMKKQVKHHKKTELEEDHNEIECPKGAINSSKRSKAPNPCITRLALRQLCRGIALQLYIMRLSLWPARKTIGILQTTELLGLRLQLKVLAKCWLQSQSKE